MLINVSAVTVSHHLCVFSRHLCTLSVHNFYLLFIPQSAANKKNMASRLSASMNIIRRFSSRTVPLILTDKEGMPPWEPRT